MPGTLAAQLTVVRAKLENRPAGLVAHVRRVLDEALELGAYYDIDPVRIELATWGHDLYRAGKSKDLLALARERGIPVAHAEARLPMLLHGPVAAAILEQSSGVTDDEVLSAIRYHTSGAPQMPLLAKVILLADKTEPQKRRRAPALQAIRALARRDLDTALLCWADWAWVAFQANGWETQDAHWQARAAWVESHHREIGLVGRVSARAFTLASKKPV